MLFTLQCLLRRFKAYDAARELQSTIAPLMDGSVNAFLLQPKAFAARMRAASAALADLAAAVLVPDHMERSGASTRATLGVASDGGPAAAPAPPNAAPDGLGPLAQVREQM